MISSPVTVRLPILCLFSCQGTRTIDIYTSFPTRRSSDLRRRSVPGSIACPRPCPRSARLKARTVRIADRGQGLRSEEHTSELQSHVNLVCRLLLEKKKTKGGARRSDRRELLKLSAGVYSH